MERGATKDITSIDCTGYECDYYFRKGDKRFLTIYKREGSTIVQKDAVLRLTGQSRQVLESLANRYALSHRERQDLLPPTERDRNQSMDRS